MHLVNSKELLKPSTFIKVTISNRINIGTLSLLIIRYGTRVFRNYFNRVDIKGPRNLTLTRVAVVEGFYVNIILEALLYKAGIWFYSFNCSLRFRTEKENVVLRELKHISNLTFFKYKPLSTYLDIPLEIPISTAGVLVYLIIQRRVR